MQFSVQLLVILVLSASVFAVVQMDGPACAAMCVLEGHTAEICSSSCWWPEMHVRASELCTEACRVRGIESSGCVAFCLQNPIRDVLNSTNSKSNQPSPTNFFFGHRKSYHSEVRVAEGTHIGIHKAAEVTLPGAGILPHSLGSPFGASDTPCECEKPLAPVRIQFGLIDGTHSAMRGIEQITIEGTFCPAQACFVEKQIPPPAVLRYNIPVHLKWTESAYPYNENSADNVLPFLRSPFHTRPAAPKPTEHQKKKAAALTPVVTHYSALVYLRKAGNSRYSGPVIFGDTAIKIDMQGKAFTKEVKVKLPEIPFIRSYTPGYETKLVGYPSIRIGNGKCASPSNAQVGGPSGKFLVDKWIKIPKECVHLSPSAKIFARSCPDPWEKKCVSDPYTFSIVDPLSVILSGTSIN